MTVKKLPCEWFSYDPNGDGIEFHATVAKAKECATKALDAESEAASLDGEWEDGVDGICWGRIEERVGEVFCEESDDGDLGFNVDYRLLPCGESADRELLVAFCRQLPVELAETDAIINAFLAERGTVDPLPADEA